MKLFVFSYLAMLAGITGNFFKGGEDIGVCLIALSLAGLACVAWSHGRALEAETGAVSDE